MATLFRDTTKFVSIDHTTYGDVFIDSDNERWHEKYLKRLKYNVKKIRNQIIDIHMTDKISKLLSTPIITHFTDNDLYTFTCQYFILHHYPHTEVGYTFFDRNHFKYPKEVVEILKAQLNMMRDVVITDEEIAFMKSKCYFFPNWYYTFLKGYRFNPSEVTINLNDNGELSIEIEGMWWRTIMWEMVILSILSQIVHTLNGDLEKIDFSVEYERARLKVAKLIENGVRVADMGTRRRASFENQDIVLRAMSDYEKSHTSSKNDGKFLGTSNVFFAMKYGLTPIGTMSHQLIENEEVMSGLLECNFSLMKKWSEVYEGNLGIYLYDCFGDKVFFNNFSTKYAKLFDGLRIDSGDNYEQLEKIVKKYEELRIDPKTKSVIFSNGLDIDDAIQIHKHVNGCINDSYGIGTTFTCGFKEIDWNGIHVPKVDIKPMNIVIKLTKCRYSNKHSWSDCVKLSCDKGKTLGNKEKCDYLLKVIEKL